MKRGSMGTLDVKSIPSYHSMQVEVIDLPYGVVADGVLIGRFANHIDALVLVDDYDYGSAKVVKF